MGVDMSWDERRGSDNKWKRCRAFVNRATYEILSEVEESTVSPDYVPMFPVHCRVQVRRWPLPAVLVCEPGARPE